MGFTEICDRRRFDIIHFGGDVERDCFVDDSGWESFPLFVAFDSG
jgi:hypothetical protein